MSNTTTHEQNPPGPGKVPVILQPLRRNPGESRRAFAKRAVRQIKEGLARQIQEKNNQTGEQTHDQ